MELKQKKHEEVHFEIKSNMAEDLKAKNILTKKYTFSRTNGIKA